MSRTQQLNDYEDKLAYLQEIAPDHEELARLQVGYSFVNAIRMDKILREVAPSTPQEEEVQEEEVTIKDRPQELKLIYKQLRNLITKKNQLSNGFHDCRSDDERKRISTHIIKIQGKIELLEKNIRFFEQHKEMPQQPDQDKYPIPEDKFEIFRRMRSLESSISRKKNIIARYMEQGNMEKLKFHQEKLKELKIYHSYVKRAFAACPV